MGARPTKAEENIYYKCRKMAASWNGKLSSREGAAELLGVSVSTLADYELGVTKMVPVANVLKMADLYNAPELLNDYCVNQCPIGCRSLPRLDVAGLDRLTVKILAALNKGTAVKDILLRITEDGVIDKKETVEFFQVINYLEDLAKTAAEFRLWAEKNDIGGTDDAS